MSNVVAFPIKEKEQPPAPQKALVDDGQYYNFVQASQFPPSVHYAVSNLPLSSYLNDLSPEHWNNIRFGTGTSDDEGVKVFYIETILRPSQIGEFGTQHHLMFCGVSYGYLEEKPEVRAIPTDLIDQLMTYYKSYPNTKASLTLFCVAILSLFIEQPCLEFVSEGHDPDIFSLYLVDKNKTDKGWLRIGFFSDFLPILLDDAAMRMVIENMDSDKKV